MSAGRSVRRAARGPIRTRLRLAQARLPVSNLRRRPGAPDYVGIGVQRCGTSWWHSLLESHPGVAALGLGAKELHFFDQFWQRDLSRADIANYHAQFRRRPGQLCGEWTPRYLHDPWAVPALLRAAPEARLLVLLRDPIARFGSALRHARAHTGSVDADAVTDAFHRGEYGAQLRRLLELVPRERVLVLQFEQCVRRPEALLAETFDFLQLPQVDVPIGGPVNAIDRDRTAFSTTLLREARERYRADAAEVEALFPGRVDLRLWPGLEAT